MMLKAWHVLLRYSKTIPSYEKLDPTNATMQVRIIFFNFPYMYVFENASKPFDLRHEYKPP